MVNRLKDRQQVVLPGSDVDMPHHVRRHAEHGEELVADEQDVWWLSLFQERHLHRRLPLAVERIRSRRTEAACLSTLAFASSSWLDE